MNEQEAYEKWYADYKRHSPNRPTAKHGWQAGAEWQKSQSFEQEPLQKTIRAIAIALDALDELRYSNSTVTAIKKHNKAEKELINAKAALAKWGSK